MRIRTEQVVVLTKERDELLDTLRRTRRTSRTTRSGSSVSRQSYRDRANERIVESAASCARRVRVARGPIWAMPKHQPENRALLQAAALFEDALAERGPRSGSTPKESRSTLSRTRRSSISPADDDVSDR